MQVLESRGINTRSCKSRLISILKDQLPLGLIPQEPEVVWIHPASRQTPDYQYISQEKLFIEEGDQSYRLNQRTSGSSLSIFESIVFRISRLFGGTCYRFALR